MDNVCVLFVCEYETRPLYQSSCKRVDARLRKFWGEHEYRVSWFLKDQCSYYGEWLVLKNELNRAVRLSILRFGSSVSDQNSRRISLIQICSY